MPSLFSYEGAEHEYKLTSSAISGMLDEQQVVQQHLAPLMNGRIPKSVWQYGKNRNVV